MSKAEDIAQKKKDLVEYFRSFPVYKYAAASVRISEDTLKRWRDDDQDFADSLEEARSAYFNIMQGKARPEFLLERLDRDTFRPPKQEVEHGIDGVSILLEKYGIIEGQSDDRKDDGALPSASKSST